MSYGIYTKDFVKSWIKTKATHYLTMFVKNPILTKHNLHHLHNLLHLKNANNNPLDLQNEGTITWTSATKTVKSMNLVPMCMRIIFQYHNNTVLVQRRRCEGSLVLPTLRNPIIKTETLSNNIYKNQRNMKALMGRNVTLKGIPFI